MFKLVVLSVLVALAAAKPQTLVGSLISEKTIESHGNSVVHPSAHVVSTAYAPAPVVYQSPLYVAHEKTIESHGNSIVHSAAPVYTAAKIVEPVVYTSYAAPALIAEKTVSNYGHSVLHHGGPVHSTYLAPTYAYL